MNKKVKFSGLWTAIPVSYTHLIFMLDLIADTVWRCVFQFTDKKRPVMGKLQDHRLWCDHPVSRFFPETVQKCDGICRNVRPGSGGKPAVMPDLIIVIPT